MHSIFFHSHFFPRLIAPSLHASLCWTATILLYVHTYTPHSLSPISSEQIMLNHNLAHNQTKLVLSITYFLRTLRESVHTYYTYVGFISCLTMLVDLDWRVNECLNTTQISHLWQF